MPGGGAPAHHQQLGLAVPLERHVRFPDRRHERGDVFAESCGGREGRRLKESLAGHVEIIEFFLLQDIVEKDFSAVRFQASLEEFATSAAIPGTLEDYQVYRQRAIAFIEARNGRVLQAC